MIFITAIGILTILLSLIMIVKPQYWSDGIITFSQKAYFHWFEVLSRLIAGVLFIVVSAQSTYPNLLFGIGCLLVTVGVGLTLLGPAKHKQFAVWSATKFKATFRPAGTVSLMFGVFLVYISI